MKPERHQKPLNYVGGYTLDLYCQFYVADGAEQYVRHGSPGTFLGNTFGGAAQTAKRRGWIIDKANRLATCPRCAKDLWLKK
jgi:hypothetical protein